MVDLRFCGGIFRMPDNDARVVIHDQSVLLTAQHEDVFFHVQKSPGVERLVEYTEESRGEYQTGSMQFHRDTGLMHRCFLCFRGGIHVPLFDSLEYTV